MSKSLLARRPKNKFPLAYCLKSLIVLRWCKFSHLRNGLAFCYTVPSLNKIGSKNWFSLEKFAYKNAKTLGSIKEVLDTKKIVDKKSSHIKRVVWRHYNKIEIEWTSSLLIASARLRFNWTDEIQQTLLNGKRNLLLDLSKELIIIAFLWDQKDSVLRLEICEIAIHCLMCLCSEGHIMVISSNL